MQGQDWEEVIIRKRPPKLSAKQAPIEAKRAGLEVETHKKYDAGKNKAHVPVIAAKKLEEDEDVKLPTISREVFLAISQTRTAKGWTQKEFAIKINEPAAIVSSYESGKAVPSPQILGKMERTLGVKLRGANIGTALEKPGKK